MTLLSAKKDNLYLITTVGGETSIARRLLDMGFTPQTKIFVAGVAPFGGTILVGIRGVLVALREDAAGLVGIKPLIGTKPLVDTKPLVGIKSEAKK